MPKRTPQRKTTSRKRVAHLRRSVLFAFLALLSQTIVSLLPMPAEAMGGKVRVEHASSAFLVLCQPVSENGGQFVPKPGKGALHGMAQCPVCQAIHLMGSLVPPVPVAVAYPCCCGPPSLSAVAGTGISVLITGAHRARGPPASV